VKKATGPLALFALLALALVWAAPARAAGSAPDADSVVALKVRLALYDKLGLDARHIDVAESGGKVILTGTVEKRDTAKLAENVAQGVEGVKDVSSDLKYVELVQAQEKVGAAATEAERQVKDSALHTRVKLTLIDKMGRDGFRIGTDAASGVVVLGFPSDFDKTRRKQAIEIAEKVQGVLRVVDVDKH